MGFAISLLLIGVGAVLTFAVDATANGVDLDMVGWILMGLGAIGLIASIIVYSSWSTGVRRRAVTERRTTAGGDVIVEDELVR